MQSVSSVQSAGRLPALLLAGALALGALPASAEGPAGVAQGPVKIPAKGLVDGSAFKARGVVKANEGGVATLDRSLGKSADGTLEAGIYESGEAHESYEAYPSDEFMFFIEGHLKLTGADGKVLEAGPQEGVFIPKGWKGRWDSTAYRKYYVVYTPAH